MVPFIVADRRERPAEAVDGAEIGGERVFAAERRRAGLAGLPGPELARRFDLAVRDRIDQPTR